MSPMSLRKRKLPRNIRDLDAIHAEILRVNSKLMGVAGILAKASTEENGLLDLDPALNGVGHILEDCVSDLEGVNSEVSEHAVAMANLKASRKHNTRF